MKESKHEPQEAAAGDNGEFLIQDEKENSKTIKVIKKKLVNQWKRTNNDTRDFLTLVRNMVTNLSIHSLRSY